MAAVPVDAEAPKKGPSLVLQLIVFLVLTVLAVGGGWMTGQLLGGEKRQAESAGEQAGADEHSSDEHDAEKVVESLRILPLETMTTNLADPQEVWIRLELALVFQDQPDPEIAEVVHQDLLAYLRTVKARQIDGPSGFQHFKSDLDERAQIRSDGKVKQVLIRTMLFE